MCKKSGFSILCCYWHFTENRWNGNYNMKTVIFQKKKNYEKILKFSQNMETYVTVSSRFNFWGIFHVKTHQKKRKVVRSKIGRVSLYYSKYKKEGSLSICKQLEPIRKSFLPRIRMSIARLPKVVKRAKLCSRVTVYTTLGPLYSRHKTFSRSSKLSEKYG